MESRPKIVPILYKWSVIFMMVLFSVVIIITLIEELSMPPDLPDEIKRIDFDAAIYWKGRDPRGLSDATAILISDYKKNREYTLISKTTGIYDWALSPSGKYILYISVSDRLKKWLWMWGGKAKYKLNLVDIAAGSEKEIPLDFANDGMEFFPPRIGLMRFVNNDSCIFYTDPYDVGFYEYNIYTNKHRKIYFEEANPIPVYRLFYDEAGGGLFIGCITDSKKDYYFYSDAMGELQKIDFPSDELGWQLIGGNSKTQKVYFIRDMSWRPGQNSPSVYNIYEFDTSAKTLRIMREKLEFTEYKFSVICLRENRFLWGTIYTDSTRWIGRYDLQNKKYTIYGEGRADYLHFVTK